MKLNDDGAQIVRLQNIVSLLDSTRCWQLKADYLRTWIIIVYSSAVFAIHFDIVRILSEVLQRADENCAQKLQNAICNQTQYSNFPK